MIEALADLARTVEVHIWAARIVILVGVVIMAIGLYLVVTHIPK